MAARTRARKAAATRGLFGLAERQLLGFYDAGLLSPAILQHTLAAFSGEPVDWNTASSARSVDGRTLAEIVVATMMPGRATSRPQKDFLSIVAHIAGGASTAETPEDADIADEPEENDEDEALLAQLGGAASRSKKSPTAPATPKKAAGFNPLVGARGLPGRNKR